MRPLPLVFFLAACATRLAPPPGPPDEEAFQVSGRFAVRYGEDGGSGQIEWRHTRGQDEIQIRNPLGSTLALISRSDDLYALKLPDRDIRYARDPDALTEQALGWRLPLRGLPYWIRGRASPELPVALRLPEAAAADGAPPEVLEQDGWRIEYPSREARSGLPDRVNLSRGDLRIRLLLDQWGAS